jgi:hypothetical protein
LPNPVTTDEFGTFSYYAPDDYYREDTWFGGKLRFKEIVAIGTGGTPGGDLSLRTNLGATNGADLVNFTHSATNAKGTVGGKLKTSINPYDYPFNCTGDGTADDTAKFQQAVNFVTSSPISRSLVIPGDLQFKLTAPIVPTRPLRIVGEGVEEFSTAPTGVKPTHGSWLYLAHTGVGILADFSANTTMTGFILEGIGTYRDQPTPGASWAPNDHDYDVSLISCAGLIDMVMLNPTRGLNIDKGHYARVDIRKLHGQAFKNLLKVDHFYDVADLAHIRQWSFWADNTNVHAYTEANLDTVYLLRVDDPQIGNLFSIRHRSALRVGQSTDLAVDLPGGSTALLKCANITIDEGKYGLWIDNTVTTATPDIDIANFSVQGNNLVNSAGVLIEGSNARVSLENPDLRSFGKQAISVTGTGNTVTLNDRILVANVDHDAAGVAAIEAASGNTITLNTVPSASGLGSGGMYGGAGTILTPDWRNWTPTITSGSGSFVSAPTQTVHAYQRHNNKVDIDLQFTLPVDVTTGTPAGAINVTLPFTPVGDVVLYGGGATKGLFGRAGPGVSTIPITNTDGTSAIASGAILILRGSYRV